MQSPSAFVPVLTDLFKPQSVVDFGCGVGNFLKVFKDNGVNDLLGIDGEWVDRQVFQKYMSLDHFRATDLTQPLDLGRKYDLAISFEVAEHLPPEAADQFIRSLTNASDRIVFSAAIPFQAGQNHLNEQWPEYWAEIFAKYNYRRLDLIRPRIWNLKEIQVWYRQNTFVYVREGVQIEQKADAFPENFEAIHPDMYYYKAKMLEDIHQGKMPFVNYLKFIVKALMNRTGLR